MTDTRPFHVVFDTSDLPARDRFEAWRTAYSPVFDAALTKDANLARFQSKVEYYQVGNSAVVGRDRIAGGVRFRRDSRWVARHDDVDHLVVELCLAGRLSVECKQERIDATPGTLWHVDLLQEATGWMSTDSLDMLIVLIPRHRLERRGLRVGSGCLREGSMGERLLREYLFTIWGILDKATEQEAKASIDGLVEIVTGLFSGMGEGTERSLKRAVRVSIMRYISRHLADPDLNVERLSREFRCSRRTLARLFRDHGGVAQYIRNQRLRRCLLELTSSQAEHRRIIDVAMAWGFNNAAHFSRLFREIYGFSPREAREYAKQRNDGPEPLEGSLDPARQIHRIITSR